MGLGRDYLADPDPPEEHPEGPRTVWKTRDGREIPFEEMTDDHLENAISFTLGLWPELIAEYRRRHHELK